MRANELKEDEYYGDLQAVFGKDSFTANNPFYTPTLNAAIAKYADGDNISKTGGTNRMRLTSLGRGIYKFELELIIYYKRGTRAEAYIYVTGQWSKKTGKVAGVTAQWQHFRGGKLLPLSVKKSGTSVAAMYDDIVKNACGFLANSIKQYIDSFKAYYSRPGVENMPPKFFD